MKRLGLALAALIILGAAQARAELPACALSASPLVELSTEIDEASDVQGSSLEAHLSAALAARGFLLCHGAAEPSPRLATLRIVIAPVDSAPLSAEIELSDAVTRKSVARRLELSGIPADSRPLAIASSADELLRASWAELTLVDAPPPAAPPPPAVTRAVETSQRPQLQAPRAELALEGSADVRRYLTAFGARARLAYWMTPRWALFFATGTAWGLRRTSEHGSVSLAETGAELGVDYAWLPSSAPLGVAVEGGLSAQRLSFSASPALDADGTSFASWSAMASARLRGWCGSRRVRATLSIGARYGLRPARAYDEARIVTSNEGAGFESLAGVSFLF